MKWYTVNYLRETEKNRDLVDAAQWKLVFNGFDWEPVTGALERKRRQEYLGFIYLDTSGFGAEEFLFFFSTDYKADYLSLTDHEVQGILGNTEKNPLCF